MTHMLTYPTAQEVNLSGPMARLGSGQPFDIEDIAHALSIIPRFTGHTCRPYSVGEHSLLVLAIVRAGGHGVHTQMAALLHDAHEAYTNDLSTPAKAAVDGHIGAWSAFERSIAQPLREQFGIGHLAPITWDAVRYADLKALATERRDLTKYDPHRHSPWYIIDNPGNPIKPWGRAISHHTPPWERVRDGFLAEYESLRQSIRNAQQAQAAEKPAAP
jgi:hypothetical protein